VKTRNLAIDQSPKLLMALGFVAIAFLGLPLLSLLGSVNWSDFPALLSTPASLEAIRLSIVTSISATVIAIFLGVPLALILARSHMRGLSFVRVLVLIPLVLPPVVGGVALLMAFGRRGIIGSYLYDWFGVQLPFTTTGVVLAQTFVAMPFLVITVESALRSLSKDYEHAASTLGASRMRIFIRIQLPLIAPALAAGALLTWARALGEFGATLTFAGNFPGVTQTLPLAVYSTLEIDRDQAISLSVVMLLIAFAALFGMRDRFIKSGLT
jgi:molybdate transport system permease protein